MHSIKRFITFVLALALALSIMTTSYAVDEVEAEELTAIDMQSDIETRAITEPTRYKNLSSGSYEARIIDLPPTRSTLTNYYFSTGTGTIIHILTQRKGTEHTGLYFTIVNGLLVCYVVALVSLLLSPRNFWVYIWFYVFNGYPGCTIGPFLQPYFNFVPNIIQCILGNLELNLTLLEAFFANFMLFVPMGVFTRLKQNKMSPALIVVPITIELLQPIIGRSFDIDDIIAYTCGGLLGYLITALLMRWRRRNNCQKIKTA